MRHLPTLPPEGLTVKKMTATVICMTPGPLLTDRTTVTTDWTCGRRRYWYKEFDGTGIVPVEEAQELTDGIDFHTDMAAVARGEDFEDAPDPGDDADYRLRERWARRIASRFAFREWVWPQMVRLYGEPVAVEAELIHEHGRLWVATTPDLVIPAGPTELIVDDYKSFSAWDVSRWAGHWPFAVQMHVQLAAAEREYGRPVRFGRVRGIVKGQIKEGLLRHPYVWAYTNGVSWQPEWKAGWELRPTWEHPGGPIGYAQVLGPEAGMSLFPLSQPIFKNDRLLQAFMEQTERREAEVDGWRHLPESLKVAKIPEVFRQNFEACRPASGRACPFLAACHNLTVGSDPLGSGLYARRKPHHDLETIMAAQESSDE